jgi:hypothetical protein
MLAGAAVIAASLVGWYWPQDTERNAMEEMGRAGGDRLPLALAGPMSNGYWGTGVFILVLATALTAIVTTYFYLGGDARSGGEAAPMVPIAGPGAAGALIVAGAGAAVATVRAIRGGRRTGVLVGLLVSLGLAGAHLWLLFDAVMAAGLAPATDGRDSAFAAVAGFQALVTLILLVMLAVAAMWAVARPGDARGHAAAWNASLLYYFTAASGAITVATLYVVPRIG